MARTTTARPTWGVLGGMGPHASAEFMKTIYGCAAHAPEQSLPVVILWSDPTVPDRTDALFKHEDDLLVRRLEDSVTRLLALPVDRVVICCVTIHAVLPRLGEALRARVLSLVDVIFAEVLRRRGRHVLLCTEGTRASGLFQAHPCWQDASSHIVLPDEEDQHGIHELIYELKRTSWSSTIPAAMLNRLLTKYAADSLIVGCTELHLWSRATHNNERCWIDPLTLVAKHIGSPTSTSMELPSHDLPH